MEMGEPPSVQSADPAMWVKARRADSGAAEALEAVNTHRIARAAQYYLARNPHLADTPLRFDVIFVAPRAWPRHVVNAFDAS